MNKSGRKVLRKVLDELERLRDPIVDRKTALEILKDSQDIVEKSMDNEEFAIDCIPENLRWSERASTMSDIHSDLIDANGELEGIIEDCEAMEAYSYPLIEHDVLKAVHAIRLAINR